MRQACQLFWAAGPAAGSGHSLPCRAADLGLRAARGCPRAAHLVRVRVVQAVARRQDQRTLVLVLLPTTLKTALCTVWSLALLGAIDTFRDHGACRMQGRGLPALASLRDPRTVERAPGMRRSRRWRWFGATASRPVSGASRRSETERQTQP